jgi:hypothetical protein
MPSPQQFGSALLYQRLYPGESVGGKPTVAGEAHGFQPELRHFVLLLDVNVRRFVALIAVEEEAIGTFSQNRGHRR